MRWNTCRGLEHTRLIGGSGGTVGKAVLVGGGVSELVGLAVGGGGVSVSGGLVAPGVAVSVACSNRRRIGPWPAPISSGPGVREGARSFEVGDGRGVSNAGVWEGPGKGTKVGGTATVGNGVGSTGAAATAAVRESKPRSTPNRNT